MEDAESMPPTPSPKPPRPRRVSQRVSATDFVNTPLKPERRSRNEVKELDRMYTASSMAFQERTLSTLTSFITAAVLLSCPSQLSTGQNSFSGWSV
mmetsp:Transcript_31880/g.62275  ORF Transcript_31880/g.62275 Transcript_31880/m.62275 type:complete len:96 (-) Transcript_31880:71-358(-)